MQARAVYKIIGDYIFQVFLSLSPYFFVNVMFLIFLFEVLTSSMGGGVASLRPPFFFFFSVGLSVTPFTTGYS